MTTCVKRDNQGHGGAGDGQMWYPDSYLPTVNDSPLKDYYQVLD